ncbi:MAG TPA: HNH endonuclease signature motif containing protein [Nocardioides sp.]|nr:HNH endonuclease signature motif containing protein [Nocardioides sp.]
MPCQNRRSYSRGRSGLVNFLIATPQKGVASLPGTRRTCAFPWCARTARGCDLDHLDHVVPYDSGGATASDNLAPLCRRHHRLKTFGRWRYEVTGPAAYAWTSPHGLRFHRDQHGTAALDP